MAQENLYESFGGGDTSDMADLRDLILQNKAAILELRAATSSLLSGITSNQLKDDLFLLRYVLSYRGDTAKAYVKSLIKATLNVLNLAANAVAQSVHWRKKNYSVVKKAMQADHMEQDVEFPAYLLPYIPSIRSYLAAWGHKCTRNGQPIVLILCDYIIFSNEVEYWWCDQCSRKTGKVHKTYRVIDMKGTSTKFIDLRFMKLFSQVSKISEFLHPQLVGKTILVNPPSLVRVLIDGLRSLGLSKRALGKLWLHKTVGNKPIAEHEDIAALINPEEIPTFLGGKCTCSMGCIPGVSNDATCPKKYDVTTERSKIDRLLNEYHQSKLSEKMAEANIPHNTSELEAEISFEVLHDNGITPSDEEHV